MDRRIFGVPFPEIGTTDLKPYSCDPGSSKGSKVSTLSILNLANGRLIARVPGVEVTLKPLAAAKVVLFVPLSCA